MLYAAEQLILHEPFLNSKSVAYKKEWLQIERGLWWRMYSTSFYFNTSSFPTDMSKKKIITLKEITLIPAEEWKLGICWRSFVSCRDDIMKTSQPIISSQTLKWMSRTENKIFLVLTPQPFWLLIQNPVSQWRKLGDIRSSKAKML